MFGDIHFCFWSLISDAEHQKNIIYIRLVRHSLEMHKSVIAIISHSERYICLLKIVLIGVLNCVANIDNWNIFQCIKCFVVVCVYMRILFTFVIFYLPSILPLLLYISCHSWEFKIRRIWFIFSEIMKKKARKREIEGERKKIYVEQ